MRHSRRHLPYAVSTVAGLAAPALAALLLTASTPGLAAVPAPAPLPSEPVAHAIGPVGAFPSTLLHAARPAAPHVAAHLPAPRAAARHVVVRHAVRPHHVVRRSTRPATHHVVRQVAQPRGADDYPYRTQSDFYAIDRWGFTERQCVSFAAWRLAQHGHAISNDDHWGSAYSWDDTARRLGFTVTTTPHVGAVAQWNAHESSPYYSAGSSRANGTFSAGGYGHVGWVKKVYADGSVLVEQYNMGGSRSYSVMRVKAPRYLVIA